LAQEELSSTCPAATAFGSVAMLALGIALAALAATLGTVSKQLLAAAEHYKKAWLFYLGAGINIVVGPVVDASAYAFAPQVVVAPLASLDVIINALTAPRILHWQEERLTRSHLLGVLMVSCGAVGTSLFAKREGERSGVMSVYDLEAQLLRPASVGYLAAELLIVLAVCGLLKRGRLGPAARGLSLGAVAGLLMGNVFFAKGLLAIIRSTVEGGGWDAWARPTPYLLALGAVGGALGGNVVMRRGLAEYKGIFIVTIIEGAHIFAACLSGCVVMSEMDSAPWWRCLLYLCGVMMILGGLFAVNTAAADAQIGSEDSHEPSQAAARPGCAGARGPIRRKPGCARPKGLGRRKGFWHAGASAAAVGLLARVVLCNGGVASLGRFAAAGVSATPWRGPRRPQRPQVGHRPRVGLDRHPSGLGFAQ